MSYKEISTVGRSDGEYTKKIKIISKNKVALKAFEVRSDRKIGGIYTVEEYEKNCRLNQYEITDIGSEAKKHTGLDVGDIVCADQLARFYDTHPMSVIRYDSIIFKLKEYDSDEIYPLNGTAFVKPDKLKEEVTGGVIKLTDLLPIGTITHINTNGINKCDLKIGDKVLLTSNFDNVYFKGQNFYIYKIPNIDALIEES